MLETLRTPRCSEIYSGLDSSTGLVFMSGSHTAEGQRGKVALAHRGLTLSKNLLGAERRSRS